MMCSIEARRYAHMPLVFSVREMRIPVLHRRCNPATGACWSSALLSTTRELSRQRSSASPLPRSSSSCSGVCTAHVLLRAPHLPGFRIRCNHRCACAFFFHLLRLGMHRRLHFSPSTLFKELDIPLVLTVAGNKWFRVPERSAGKLQPATRKRPNSSFYSPAQQKYTSILTDTAALVVALLSHLPQRPHPSVIPMMAPEVTCVEHHATKLPLLKPFFSSTHPFRADPFYSRHPLVPSIRHPS